MGRLLVATGDGRGVDAREVRRALALLADPANAIQLQYAPFHGQSHRTFPGTPSGLDDATQWVKQHGSARALYYALNPVPVGFAGQVTCAAVLSRRWLLVDIDRKKTPADKELSATDDEHDKAKSLAFDVLEYLMGKNWPDPLVIDSGNGYHLLYRLELPNTDASRVHVKTILLKLAQRFDDDRGTVGAECYDARRISALPGTWKRKGPASKDRPHRMVRLIGGPA